ncbi:MAG: AI-2E family transporter, partial [bacterium]
MDELNVSRSILNVRNLVVLAIFGLMIWFVVIVRNIIGIFLFSMVIAFLLYPLVDLLHKKKIPRSISILIIYLVVLIAFGLIMLVIVPPLVHQAEGVINFIVGSDGKSALAVKTSAWLEEFINKINSMFGTNIDKKELWVVNQEKTSAILGDIFKQTKNFVGGVASFVTILVAIPAICFYLLMDWPKIKKSLLKFLPPHLEKSSTKLMDHLTRTLNSYLRGQLKLSFMMFLITTTALLVLNAFGAVIPDFGFHIGPWLLLGILA